MWKNIKANIYCFIASKLPVDARLRTIRPDEGYNYFSGYSTRCGNLPVLYASNSGVRAGDYELTVTGRNFYGRYPIVKLEEAIKAYKELLKQTGYLS